MIPHAMADNNRVQVNMRVSQAQKDDWEAFVENHPEANSLSHLVRMSVQKEIARETHEMEASADASVGGTEEMAEALDRLDRVDHRLEDIDGRLTEIRHEQSENAQQIEEATTYLLSLSEELNMIRKSE